MPVTDAVKIKRYKMLIESKFELFEKHIYFIYPDVDEKLVALKKEYQELLKGADSGNPKKYAVIESSLETKFQAFQIETNSNFNKKNRVYFLDKLGKDELAFENDFNEYIQDIKNIVDTFFQSPACEKTIGAQRPFFEMKVRWLNEKKLLLAAIVLTDDFKSGPKKNELNGKIKQVLIEASEYRRKYNSLLAVSKSLSLGEEAKATKTLNENYGDLNKEISNILYDVFPEQIRTELKILLKKYKYSEYKDKKAYKIALEQFFDLFYPPLKKEKITMLTSEKVSEKLKEFIGQPSQSTTAKIAKSLRNSRISQIFTEPSVEDEDKKLNINYDILKKNIIAVYKNLASRKIPFGEEYEKIATLARALSNVKTNEAAILADPKSDKNKFLKNELVAALQAIYDQLDNISNLGETTSIGELKSIAEEYLAKIDAKRYLPEKFASNVENVPGDKSFPSSDTNRSKVWSMNGISEQFIAAAGPTEFGEDDFIAGILECKPRVVISLGSNTKDFMNYTKTGSTHGNKYFKKYFDSEQKLEIKEQSSHELLHEVKTDNFPLPDNSSFDFNFSGAQRYKSEVDGGLRILVHCASGVGRTGHFILTGILAAELLKKIKSEEFYGLFEKLKTQELKPWEMNMLAEKMETTLNSIRSIRYFIQAEEQLYNVLPELVKLQVLNENISEAQFKELKNELEKVRFENVAKELINSDVNSNSTMTRNRSNSRAPKWEPTKQSQWHIPVKNVTGERRVSVGNREEMMRSALEINEIKEDKQEESHLKNTV